MQVDNQNYKDLGQSLQNVRTSMKLELREVAQRLHIRAKYLAALEEGDLQVIPGKVYARGYLRQYAEFLGLNADETAAAFDRVASTPHVKYFVPEPTSRAYQPGFIVVAIALAGLFIAYMYWYRTHKAIQLPPSHELVAPVPERLLTPVLQDTPASLPTTEETPSPGAEAPAGTPPDDGTGAPLPANEGASPAAEQTPPSAPAKTIVPVDASKVLPWHKPQSPEQNAGQNSGGSQ